MGIAAGNLNKQVVIQKPARAFTAGEAAVTWIDVAAVWAQIRPATSREVWQAKQAQAELTHRVTIRYRADMTAELRIQYGTRILNLVGPPRNIDEANEILEMDCVEQA